MMISVWNPKGGVGKTTIAINLAAAIRATGRSVILADMDPQGSASLLAADGNFPFPVFEGLPKDRSAEVVVLDHAPGYLDLPEAHALVFPMRLSRPDMQAGIRAAARVNVKKLVVVFNDVDFRRGVERATWNQARKLTMFAGAKLVRSRVVYRVAHDQGRTVFDAALDSIHAVADARLEIRGILKK